MYSFLLSSFVFIGIYFHFNDLGIYWKNKIVCSLHAIVTSIACFVFFSQQWKGIHGIGFELFALKVLEPLDPTQKVIVDFSLSYFIIDTAYLFASYQAKNKMMYVIHHLSSIYIWSLVRYHNVAGGVVILSLFLGELSNPFKITWEICKDVKYDKGYRLFSHLFTWIFVSIRCFIGPVLTWKIYQRIGHIEISPGSNVMTQIWLTLALGIFGGFVWSYSLIKGYMKFLNK